jgi:hypothetical protein
MIAPRLVAHWKRGEHRFEIFDEDDPTHGVVYIGYYDGKRSVCSRTEPGAASGLIRKHINGLPDALIIEFPLPFSREKVRA